jgi:hypothetical protein
VWQLAAGVAGSVAAPGVPFLVYAIRQTRQNNREEAAFLAWATTGKAQPGGHPRMCWSSAMPADSPFQSWRVAPTAPPAAAPVVAVRPVYRRGDPVPWWVAEAPAPALPWWDVRRLRQVTSHRDPRWDTRRAVTAAPADRRAA